MKLKANNFYLLWIFLFKKFYSCTLNGTKKYILKGDF